MTDRAAACVALLAPIAMVVVAVAALVGDLLQLLAAVGLLLVTVAAMWFALTNRGPRRFAGWLVTVLGFAGLVVVLALHWEGIVVLIALLALAALYGASASYALGRTRPAAPAAVPARAVTGPGAGTTATEKSVLLINPKSGGGKAQRFDLVGEARRRGVEPVVLEPGDDLLELAQDAIARGARIIGMAGGEVSLALVATVASRHDVAHVCVPAGTRNHFALDLGLDRDDVVGALDAFTAGREHRIDLSHVNERVFVNNASLGVYAKVVQSLGYRDAKLATWLEMLPDLFGPAAPPLDLEFTTPDGSSFGDAALVLVSNNPYQVTSLAGAGSRASIDGGVLGVVAARVRTPADVSKKVGFELIGQVSRFPGLMTWSSPDFEVHSEAPVEVGLDGEALVLDPPLRFGSLPGALRVRLPPAAGLAPAARAVPLTTDSLRELLALAAGR